METRRKKILIVDDIELNRAILNALFCKEYTVVEAENGKEALEQLAIHQEQIVAILLDIVMPVMDGFKVLEEMEASSLIDRYPIFLITAEDSDTVINRGYDMGVFDVIHKPFNPSIIRRRVGNSVELYSRRFNMESIICEQTEKLKATSMGMVDALGTVIEFRDCESGMHIQRIRSICKTLMTEISKENAGYRFAEQEIADISMAAAMHDVGKISIPDYILNKPGRLTADEFEIMKEHTVRGCEILESVKYIKESDFYRYYYDICRWHHEKWDGRGYPDGLTGDEIPIWSQIVALADCYDALVSKRVYKPPYSHDEAVTMIVNGECGQFNPVLLNVFIKVSGALAEINKTLHMEEQPKYQHPSPRLSREVYMKPREDAATQATERTLRLLELERRSYEVLADLTQDIIFTYYAGSDTVEFSDRFREIFDGEAKYEKAMEKLGNDLRISAQDKAVVQEKLKSLTIQEPTFHLEFQMKTREGVLQWFEVFIHSFWDEENPKRYVRLLGKITNVNKRREEVNKWKNAAIRDSLTGLLNNRAVENVVNKFLSEEANLPFTLFIIDVDDFKQINDNYGHIYGDKILKALASVIQSKTRSHDIVGRIGGDEFVIILKGVEDQTLISRRAREIGASFRDVGGEDGITISASIGIAKYPHHDVTYKGLLEKADIALYTRKRQGKDGFVVYDSQMEKEDKEFQSALSKMDNEG